MKHEWIDATPDGPDGWFREVRRCLNCGAVQEKEDVGTWGRVKLAWRPLVGRCLSQGYYPGKENMNAAQQIKATRRLLLQLRKRHSRRTIANRCQVSEGWVKLFETGVLQNPGILTLERVRLALEGMRDE